MTHMNYKEQAGSGAYDGPNPIRMTERDWVNMTRALAGAHIQELNALRDQAHYAARMVLIAPPVALPVAQEEAEKAMSLLLERLAELGVRFSVPKLVSVGEVV